MGTVFIAMAISVDGYVARPDISSERPFGTGGEQVYDWQFAKRTDDDIAVLDELMARCGAVIAGRRTYALAIDGAWGGANPFPTPVFVLASKVPDAVADGFQFVTSGPEEALNKAKAAARDKDVWIMGGATVAQWYLHAGLVDELHLHVAPLLLGEGIRLWEHVATKPVELRHAGLTQTPGATHLRYQVVK